jgi:hypothetical protein
MQIDWRRAWIEASRRHRSGCGPECPRCFVVSGPRWPALRLCYGGIRSSSRRWTSCGFFPSRR